MISAEKLKNCTRCLICEMVCSFHHTQMFSKSHSSIKVHKAMQESERGPRITIYHQSQGGNPACDSCRSEESPLCVRFCPEDVLKTGGR